MEQTQTTKRNMLTGKNKLEAKQLIHANALPITVINGKIYMEQTQINKGDTVVTVAGKPRSSKTAGDTLLHNHHTTLSCAFQGYVHVQWKAGISLNSNTQGTKIKVQLTESSTLVIEIHYTYYIQASRDLERRSSQ